MSYSPRVRSEPAMSGARQSLRILAPAQKSSSRSKSPAGTRRSVHPRSEQSDGPQILLHPGDGSPPEEHELVEQQSRSSLKGSDGNLTGRHGTAMDTAEAEDEPHYTSVLRSRNTPPTRQTGDGDSDFSESNMTVQRKNLTTFDVAALIFNKMVGTGIFTTPGAVLALTGSKQLSIGLWAVGGVYSFISVLIYLEYGQALPFTGGELIYLNEVFNRPQLLATILASSYFLILWNSSPNAFAFAKHVLLAAVPSANSSNDFDHRLVRFIGFVILTTICLLHYFSGQLGMFLNKLLALFKVCLLFSIFVAGMIASGKDNSGAQDWTTKFTPGHGSRGTSSLAALVLILYSYTGWENANYVLGEIIAPQRMLRKGAVLAVGTVMILYILVACAYYAACDYAAITSKETDLGMAVLFAPVAFGNTLGLKISISLSAVGNLIAVIYTASKVKQVIARQGIIPFHELLSKNINIPKGGLFLQWLASTLFLIFTPTSGDGYSFIIGLQTYSHVILSIFVALGIWRLQKRMSLTIGNYKLSYLRHKFLRYPVLGIFIGFNIIILVVSALIFSKSQIKRWLWPVISISVYGGAIIYWAVFWALQRPFKRKSTDDNIVTFGRYIGFEPIVHDANEPNPPEKIALALAESRFDGTYRRTEYKFSGFFAMVGGWVENVKRFSSWFF